MSKFIAKMVKNVALFSVIFVLLVAISVLVTAVKGVNYAATLEDCNSLTITVNNKAFEDKIDAIEEKCEAAFEENGVKYNLVKYGEMSGDDCEIVYEFSKAAKLDAVKESLSKTFAQITSEEGEWNGTFISVSSASEDSLVQMPVNYVLRTAVAVAVFAVLAFIYVSLRYRLNMGVLTAIASVLGAIASAAIVLLLRIPVTNSLLYIVALAAPVTAVLVLLTFNKARAAMREEKEKTAEEFVASSVAVQEIEGIAVVGGVALVLLFAIATAAVRWFALAAFVSFVATLFVGVLLVPAMYVPVKQEENERAALKTKSGYVGAEKQN